jgi:hypothetical protein
LEEHRYTEGQITMDLISQLNERIIEFVTAPENSSLKRGTGAFSAPFRGNVLGARNKTDIGKAEKADVLWLGSNPNGRVSSIINHDYDCYPYFEYYIKSQACSEVYESEGVDQIVWDPLSGKCESHWNFYANCIGDVLRTKDTTAFANYILWGSGNLKEFLRLIRNYDQELLNRILVFCESLCSSIITELKPKVILVPLSMRKELPSIFSERRISNLVKETIQEPSCRKRLYYYCGDINVNSHQATVIFAPHPSAVNWYGRDNKLVFQKELIDKLSSLLR